MSGQITTWPLIIARPATHWSIGKRLPFHSGPIASSSTYQHCSLSRMTKATPSASRIRRAALRTTSATSLIVRVADSDSIISIRVVRPVSASPMLWWASSSRIAPVARWLCRETLTCSRRGTSTTATRESKRHAARTPGPSHGPQPRALTCIKLFPWGVTRSQAPHTIPPRSRQQGSNRPRLALLTLTRAPCGPVAQQDRAALS